MKKLSLFTLLLCALLSGRMWAVGNSMLVHRMPFSECDTIREDVYDTLCCPADAQTKYPQLEIKKSGVYKDTTASLVTGCDSITSFHIVLLAEDPKYMPLESAVICQGDTMVWRGKKYNVEGMYFDTVRYSKSGCPGEYYSLDLKVNKVTSTVQDTTICDGDTIEWRGIKIAAANTYLDTVRYAITNCDSIHYSLNVKVNSMMEPIVKDTFICDSNFVAWQWRGIDIIKSDTSYADTVHYAKTGCDSVVYVLNVKNAFTQTSIVYDTLLCNQTAAQKKYKQFVITEAGEYKDTIASKITGCDSVIIYKINWLYPNPEYRPTEDTTICEGDMIEWRGQKLSKDSVYYDVVPNKDGCDSVIYSMNLKLYRPDRLPVTTTICQGDTLNWRGKELSKEGMYYDTIRALVMGCDSMIYSLDLKVNYVKAPIAKDTFICDGNFVAWQWRGIDIIKGDTSYADTVHYAKTGCDSVVYVLNVKSATTQTSIVYDTLCLLDAKVKYPQFAIEVSGTYVDTIPTIITQCDSIITYNIVILADPVMPKLQGFSEDLFDVICGTKLNPDSLLKEVMAKSREHQRDTANFEKIWLEVRMDKTSDFSNAKDQEVVANTDTIEVRLAGISECNSQNIIYGSKVQRVVETPTPDNLPALDTMPASNKYNNYLLMINYKKITGKGYEFNPEDVVWYRVVGEVDPVLAIKDDEAVGYGYYYTANQSLTSKYYAVIQIPDDKCGTIVRSVVLDCEATQEMTLSPACVRRGAKMTLAPINAEVATQISIYNMDGKLIKTMETKGVDNYQIVADQADGMYLLRAKSNDAEVTFKFIVNQ